MPQQVFRGTWEQLAAQMAPLQGQTLKLIIVSDEADAQKPAEVTEERLHQRLAALVQEAERLELEPGKMRGDPDEVAFDEGITAKYRKMGFQL